VNRLSWLASFLFLSGLLFAPRRAEAETPPVAVEVLSSATTEIDPAALREAVARELDTLVVSGAAVTLVVSIDRDRGELVVERHDATGSLSRRVPLPADPEQVRREAVFLIGNLARDEAADVLQRLHAPRVGAPTAPRTPAEESRVASGKSDAKRNLAPQGSGGAALAPRRPHDARPKVWLGMSVSVDLVGMPGESSACRGASGFYCVGSDGGLVATASSPSSPDPGGWVSGGLAVGNVRWLVTADYAATGNFLFGVRVGLVFNTVPSSVNNASLAGTPSHWETRATYVFGDDPLGTAGFSPYVMVAGGVTQVVGGGERRCSRADDREQYADGDEREGVGGQ
jgi:hypothetical protein